MKIANVLSQRRLFKKKKIVVLGLAIVLATPTTGTAISSPQIAGTKCVVVGATRVVRKVSYTCAVAGKKKVWLKGSGATVTTSPASKTTTTTVAWKPCRVVTEISTRLPNELQKREWESVVSRLQSVAASADTTGKTTAIIDTFVDPMNNAIAYGRYYGMNYPSVISETQGSGCAYLAMVFDVFVRFTGADTSDATAKAGIQSAVKAILQESLTKYTKVDGYDVDVVLIQPILDHCPGREITAARKQCPWNDFGYLYYRTAGITAAQVAATSASEIFSLSVSGATYPPRPFTQIVGLGPNSGAVTKGTVRNLVPEVNKINGSSTYVEFSDITYENGQTISVDDALAIGSISVRTRAHTAMVDGRPVSGSGAGISTNVQTRIYRYNGSGEIPYATRRSDFTRLVDVSQAVLFPHNSSVTFNLPSGTTLSPGKYLITFAISGTITTGVFIRLESFAEGDVGQTDVYTGGRAYRSCGIRAQIGYRRTDNPPVVASWDESAGTNCETFYPEVSKGELGARPYQHTWVWSDLAMTLNAP